MAMTMVKITISAWKCNILGTKYIYNIAII